MQRLAKETTPKPTSCVCITMKKFSYNAPSIAQHTILNVIIAALTGTWKILKSALAVQNALMAVPVTRGLAPVCRRFAVQCK